MMSKSTAEKIGDYLAYQRVKRGYSLGEFSKRSGLATSFILRLERGEYKTVKFDIIEKIAEGLSMSIEDFLMESDIIKNTRYVYPLEYYFREMYQFPESAIEDLKLFIELLEKKYKDEIEFQKKEHKKYWLHHKR